MSKNNINDALSYHQDRLQKLENDSLNDELDSLIIRASNIDNNIISDEDIPQLDDEVISIRELSFEEIVRNANAAEYIDTNLDNLLTKAEMDNIKHNFDMLSKEFNDIHKLDSVDYMISVFAGLLSATVDILFVGIPHNTYEGLKSGQLSDYIREGFNKVFSPEEMEKLAQKSISKVPYDIQTNNETIISERVEGLCTYYHRLYSLGHDPLLGFFVGVRDILEGTITTIDRNGVYLHQPAHYKDIDVRKASDIFGGICKQFIHLKSDITTSMGLPAPFMGIFNLFQFGSIGEYEQTVAEIVSSMYYEGFDFIHFCSQSVPVMINELTVRLCYSLKRIKEGEQIKKSIALSTNRNKHPKLETMLFISHSICVGINSGRIAFTKNPMAINYPEWLVFTKYFIEQLMWISINKADKRIEYIDNKLIKELDELIIKNKHMIGVGII